MRLLRTLSIKHKLMWLVTLTSSAVLLLAAGAFLAYEWFAFRNGMVMDLTTQAEIISANVAGALQFESSSRAEETLHPLRAKPHIMAAAIYSLDGRVLAKHLRADEQQALPSPAADQAGHRITEREMILFHPIKFRGERVGLLFLKSDFQPLYARLKQYAAMTILILLAASLAVFWLSSILQQIISRPIAALSETTRVVSTEKNYSIRAAKQSDDEIGVLIDGFNEMLAQIQHRDAALLKAHGELEQRVTDRTRDLREEIAERRRAEEALATEKELLSVTMRSIGDGLITTDAACRILLFNAVAEELTGWATADAAGKPLAEVFRLTGTDRTSLRENPAAEVLKSGGAVELPGGTFLIAREGTQRLIGGNGTPIQNTRGAVIGVAIAFRDITVQQELADEMLKSRKIESLGILAGGIAHDFNNILTAILGNISLARMYGGGIREVTDTLENAENACLRAKGLTDQLLTFSKGGSPVKKAASIRELIQETTLFVLRGSNVGVDFSLPSDLWPVEADAAQIGQVIDNLVINATQAMPNGGRIELKAENLTIKAPTNVPLPPGQYIHLLVSDRGVGIRPDHLSKIFDPYFTTKQKGSGLGLATAYSIMKRHGGRITVDSTLGLGSTFHLYLPANPKLVLPPPNPRAELPSGSGRILVMDDEAAIRETLTVMLKTLGYEVESVGDGAEAIQRYRSAKTEGKPFAAVIMDLTIAGGMGGKDAIARLKAEDPQVRAIVSSGYYHDPVIANFRQYGFQGVVSKPYRLQTLASVLRDVLANDAADLPGHHQALQ